MKVEVEEMPSLPENCNPYRYDMYHMGMQIGTDLLMMHANHPSEEMKYFILVNTRTGNRVRVIIEDDTEHVKDCECHNPEMKCYCGSV